MPYSVQTHRLARSLALLAALGGVIAGWSLTSVTPAQASSGPSEVRTEPAEATANGFLLKGELNPDGLPTTYYFEYAWVSTTCDEGCPTSAVAKPLMGAALQEVPPPQKTAVAGPLTGAALQEVPPVEVTGVFPGEKYRYWLISSNADGTTKGEVREFTVAKTERPSEVQTEPAEATANGFVLKGGLNPGDLPTTYYFEYSFPACDEGCTPLRTAVAGPLTGSTWQEVSPVEVTGLVPGEMYRYRLIASNADGTTKGEVLTFMTSATSERPREVQTEPESKLDPPTPLLTSPTSTSPLGGTTISPRPLTSARKLANALKACESKPKKRRARCDRRAQIRYGTAAKATKKTGKQARNGKK
jgi:hypothetical protein